MEEIKSAYEIAMERAEEITKEADGKQSKISKLKPLLARFFKGKVDADSLWGELKEEEDPDLPGEAQEMLIESLGLRTIPENFKRRREAILGLESLKSEQNSSMIEQLLQKAKQLQQNYESEREQLEERIKSELERNSQMQMKPVQTEDGQTVMQLESGVDNQTQKRFNKMLSDFEENYSRNFSALINKMKELVR